MFNKVGNSLSNYYSCLWGLEGGLIFTGPTTWAHASHNGGLNSVLPKEECGLVVGHVQGEYLWHGNSEGNWKYILGQILCNVWISPLYLISFRAINGIDPKKYASMIFGTAS